MSLQKRCQLAVALVLSVVLANTARAVDPAPTTITVERMCDGCARKITANLQQLPGVETVRPNVPAKTVAVSPKPGAVLSPRQLWETVEKSGEKPVKLEGPSGTFTQKPQS